MQHHGGMQDRLGGGGAGRGRGQNPTYPPFPAQAGKAGVTGWTQTRTQALLRANVACECGSFGLQGQQVQWAACPQPTSASPGEQWLKTGCPNGSECTTALPTPKPSIPTSSSPTLQFHPPTDQAQPYSPRQGLSGGPSHNTAPTGRTRGNSAVGHTLPPPHPSHTDAHPPPALTWTRRWPSPAQRTPCSNGRQPDT